MSGWRSVHVTQGGIRKRPTQRVGHMLTSSLINTKNVGIMAEQTLLGELEQLVLLAIIRLEDKAYAVSIRDEIEQQTGFSLSRGSIYVTLDRLEQKGYVESWFADPTPERGGKAKRYFKVRAVARRDLKDCRAALLKMWDGIEAAGKP